MKQILIIILFFILGGVIGFLINGQIHASKYREMLLNADYPTKSNGNIFDFDESRRGNRLSNSGYRRQQNLPPVINEMVQDLELSDTQKSEIEQIIRQSKVSRQDIESFRIDKITPVISDIRKTLNDEQKTKFDQLIKEHAVSAMFGR
jgi:polyhydroxyalkanoate synthesis regulator phasin